MNITQGTFWVKLRDDESSNDASAQEDGIIIEDFDGIKSFWDGADVSEQLAFATVKLNATAGEKSLGDILKAIIDALTRLATAQGIENPIVKFEIMKDGINNLGRKHFDKLARVNKIGVDEFLTKFGQ